VKLVIIDPLQGIDNYSALSPQERYKAYDMLARRLKALARKNDTPIFLTACLSAQYEEGEQLPLRFVSQIMREEGNFEFNADVILQLYREEYYDPRPENVGIATIQIIKSNDYSGGINIRFKREEGLCFTNLEE
jgi:replicative DNA helicase